eukprot:669300-Rhodomonas_salina.1
MECAALREGTLLSTTDMPYGATRCPVLTCRIVLCPVLTYRTTLRGVHTDIAYGAGRRPQRQARSAPPAARSVLRSAHSVRSTCTPSA